MKNTPEYVACLYACWHAGLVAVPINAKLHPREIAFILENSGAAVVFVTEDMAPAASEALSSLSTRKPEVAAQSVRHRGSHGALRPADPGNPTRSQQDEYSRWRYRQPNGKRHSSLAP
jgi:acyl-CoA synthetase (AMP-forming)/AMP-acid ligase II